MIVRTGTDFGSLDDDLLKHNLALVDRPQFDGLGVGGAVRSGGHGWNSRGFFIDSVVRLKGIMKGCDEAKMECVTRDVDGERFWDMAYNPKYVIL